jgi:hypothetical protein
LKTLTEAKIQIKPPSGLKAADGVKLQLPRRRLKTPTVAKIQIKPPSGLRAADGVATIYPNGGLNQIKYIHFL